MTSNRTEASYIISLHQLINTNTSKFCSIASYIGPTLVVVDIQTLTSSTAGSCRKKNQETRKTRRIQIFHPASTTYPHSQLFPQQKTQSTNHRHQNKTKNNTKKLVIIHTMTFDRTKET